MTIGVLDERLRDGAAPVEVLHQVLKDHEGTTGVCAYCEETLSRRRPVCRSVALVRAALYGQHRLWHADDVDVPRQRQSEAEQLGEFGGAA